MAGQMLLWRTLLVALALVSLNACVATAAVLRNFQVAQPPIVPQDAKECTIKILQWVARLLTSGARTEEGWTG